MSIVFKSPMDTETFADKVEIVSPEGVAWEPVVSGDQSLYLDFATQQETAYTIRFKRGAGRVRQHHRDGLHVQLRHRRH